MYRLAANCIVNWQSSESNGLTATQSNGGSPVGNGGNLRVKSGNVRTMKTNVSKLLIFRFCNIRSIYNKSLEVHLFSIGSDISAFVETRDSPELADSLFADLRSYNVFRKPRNRNGGGVAIVTKKYLKAFRRADLETSDLELLFVELPVSKSIFGVFYGPPSVVREKLIMLLDHFRTLEPEAVNRMILVGDFNSPSINWSSDVSPRPPHILHDFCEEFQFKQAVAFPTRLKNTSCLSA